jgi:hypothetical protein
MSKLVELYTGEVLAGNITENDVPAKLREQVAAAVNEAKAAQAETVGS